MYGSNQDKSNTQKLAETLKRCGLASSVSQAHQMAGDITTTERKVQSFFDQKKQEMKNDLMKSVHPNREDTKPAKANDVVSAQIQNFRQDNAKQMVENALNPKPLHVQVEFETPKTAEVLADSAPAQAPLEVFHDVLPKSSEPEHKLEVFHDTISEANETKPQAVTETEQTREKEDYINKYIGQPEAEIQAQPAAEKEEVKVDALKSEEPVYVAESVKIPEVKTEVKPYTLPPPRPQAQAMGPHPKTGQASSIDINNFFNFQKKGKL